MHTKQVYLNDHQELKLITQIISLSLCLFIGETYKAESEQVDVLEAGKTDKD